MNTGAQTSPNGGETPSDTAETDESVVDPFIEPGDEGTVLDAAAQTPGVSGDAVPLEGELLDADAVAEKIDAESPDDADEAVLQQRLTDAEARADDNWDRLLRLQAEMENQRKRAQRDVTAARKFALEGIVGDLLPVRDSLEMGLGASAEEGATLDSLREGSELTLKMLASALEKHNIVAIDPVGEKFNPEFHQAMSMQPVEGAAPNTVTSVMQKGYTLNERLIRPALVMVAK